MEKFKVGFTAVTAFLSSLLGILYIPVVLMLLCNVIDYATGLMAAPHRGQRITARRAIRGVAKKICMWLLVAVGVILDLLIQYASTTIGMPPYLHHLAACVVIVWIICDEIISILENMVDIGVDLPPFLLPLVKLIKEQTEKAGESANEKIGDKEKTDGDTEDGKEDKG